jgi:serine/threonine protein kinase
MQALESGEAPSRREFLARHAEIAQELGYCLDGLDLVHEAAQDLREGGELDEGHLTSEQLQIPLGDFRLIREIGRGGMGIVYEAIQLSLNRRVAVKILPFVASLDRTTLQRFKNEAQAAAQLHHTNIVPVYAVGSDRGVHFYAMQLIEGHALSQLIEQLRRSTGKTSGDESRGLNTRAPTDGLFNPFGSHWRAIKPTDPTEGYSSLKVASARHRSAKAASAQSASAARVESFASHSSVLTTSHGNAATYFRTVAAIVQQAAAALEHAHRFGVIHRDIKPGNILLDEQGRVWITDFGLAQLQSDSQLTRTGDMLGTLRYMSPEQASGDRVVLSHRTDIYSLGATFYELLTLEPVVAGKDRHAVLRRILEDEPRRPRLLDKRIPVELETIVLKAVAKVPGDRYDTAQQLADDLDRWLKDEPILARPPTLMERAAKWGRRHRSLVRTAAVFLALAVLGLAASTVLIERERAKAVVAYEREIEQRGAAEESFRQAQRAVDTFTRLGERELANRPAMYSLRREFLETALAYYQDFLEQRRDDPSAQAELTATSQRVAEIIRELSVVEDFAPLMLLANERVQQDLELSPTQRDQIVELTKRLLLKRSPAKTGSQPVPHELREQRLEDILGFHKDKIMGVLNRHQWQRLTQIAWQERGASAFKSPEIAAVLRLTPQQREQIGKVLHSEGPSEAWRKSDDPQYGPAHALNGIMALLTPEQLETWRKLTGKPFSDELRWQMR